MGAAERRRRRRSEYICMEYSLNLDLVFTVVNNSRNNFVKLIHLDTEVKWIHCNDIIAQSTKSSLFELCLEASRSVFFDQFIHLSELQNLKFCTGTKHKPINLNYVNVRLHTNTTYPLPNKQNFGCIAQL